MPLLASICLIQCSEQFPEEQTHVWETNLLSFSSSSLPSTSSS